MFYNLYILSNHSGAHRLNYDYGPWWPSFTLRQVRKVAIGILLTSKQGSAGVVEIEQSFPFSSGGYELEEYERTMDGVVRLVYKHRGNDLLYSPVFNIVVTDVNFKPEDHMEPLKIGCGCHL